MRNAQFSQKAAIKENIISQLKDEELKIISLAENYKNIYWEEEGKEFFFNGEMFDVVKRKEINGKEFLYCINDKKEKVLIDNYNLITKHNSSSDKKGGNNIDDAFNLFVSRDEKENDQHFILIINKFHSLVSYLSEGKDDTISPPPKAA